jgi:predicted ATP-dependent protease
MPVLVNNVDELMKISKDKEGAIISRHVGQKKKVEILKKAKDLNVKVLNLKDVDSYLKKVDDSMNKHKEEKKKQEAKKEETKKELEKKSKEAEQKKEEKTVEEKMKEEKEIKQKVLSKGE